MLSTQGLAVFALGVKARSSLSEQSNINGSTQWVIGTLCGGHCHEAIVLITLGMNLARLRNFGSQTSHYPRVLRSRASTLVVFLYLKPFAWSSVEISQNEGVCAMSNEAIRKTTHEAPLMRPFAQRCHSQNLSCGLFLVELFI